MKDKIIFLDIDGVLNGYNQLSTFGWRIVCLTHCDRLIEWYRKCSDVTGIHERKVKLLARIVHETGAKVVISSSRRFCIWNKMQFPDDEKFISLCKKYDIELIDITPKSQDGVRCKEILTWLARNEDRVDTFVVLDDERFDLECFVGSHLVQTSSVKKGQVIRGCGKENTGLRRKHVKQAIKILLNDSKTV